MSSRSQRHKGKRHTKALDNRHARRVEKRVLSGQKPRNPRRKPWGHGTLRRVTNFDTE